MKLSLNSIADKLVWLSTTILLTFFVLFETLTWGRYIFFGITLLVLLMAVIANKGVLKIKFQAYHGFLALFVLFVLISSLWTWSPAATIEKATSLFLILACSSILYIYYQNREDVHPLLTAVMWSGYFVSLYTIFFYGVENFGADVEAERLENEFANINSIGMAAALSCVLQFNELLHKRKRWTAIMLIPAVYVLAATQSRKALVFAIVGIYAVYILKTLSNPNTKGKTIKILGYTALFCVGAVLVLRLPAFKGVLERMEGMLDQESMESSAEKRMLMIQVGWDTFKQHPIGGIGIGSSHVLTMQYMGVSTYLHNNFVELLSGGGIIGFICYYASYVYLFVNLIKYRKADPAYFSICFVWLCIMLAMHYGMVTYYTKSEWYRLVIHFLNLECLKRKAKGMQNECEKIA